MIQSHVTRAMSISHRVPPTNEKQRRMISGGKIDPPSPCTRATYNVTMANNSGWESIHNDQHPVISSTCTKNRTCRVTEYMTTAKIRDEDMTTKYIAVSLVTVLRIVGTFTPGCMDLMSRVCAMTNPKTTMSKGTEGWFNPRGERE